MEIFKNIPIFAFLILINNFTLGCTAGGGALSKVTTTQPQCFLPITSIDNNDSDESDTTTQVHTNHISTPQVSDEETIANTDDNQPTIERTISYQDPIDQSLEALNKDQRYQALLADKQRELDKDPHAAQLEQDYNNVLTELRRNNYSDTKLYEQHNTAKIALENHYKQNKVLCRRVMHLQRYKELFLETHRHNPPNPTIY